VREEPRTFTALLAETGAHKNALHLAVSALKSSGLLAQTKRGAPFTLSPAFSEALDAYAGFWRVWAQTKPD
ncbi:MAG: hypothetical protein Q8P02_02550, partial [Candidatus Micrarchaeota archaeon]|nr:hypothetical protein [Candidatus Micrarchaeota archaeon]